MHPSNELVDQIISSKTANSESSKLARECMLELCGLCDTKKNFAKLNDLFSNLTDGILIFDLNFNLLDANKLGRIFYKDFKQFKYHDEIYELKDLPIVVDVQQNKNLLIDTITVTAVKSNEEKIFNISSVLTYSATSEPNGICVVINDATDIQRQALQLEDMMAAFTHDLKTPLIAAETNLKQFREGAFGDITETQQQVLELMLKSNEGALKLVKNLLSIFKFETNSYKLLIKEINIYDLVNNSIAILKPILAEKNIKIEINKDAEVENVFCDAFEIERVLINLLSNAIKYSDNNSVIKFNVNLEDGFLTVSIEDQGMGISQDKLENLFKRFWQSKINSTGTGLGLYLSKQIIEAHAGNISATSKEGVGTKVSFTIPCNSNLLTMSLIT